MMTRRCEDLLRQTLERRGYPVLTATDGREALRLIDGQAVDLVITDIVMPEQDGFEVLERLRQTRSTVPVIAISGGGAINSRHYLAVAEQLGVRRTFAKPLDLDEFARAVSEILPLDIPVGP